MHQVHVICYDINILSLIWIIFFTTSTYHTTQRKLHYDYLQRIQITNLGNSILILHKSFKKTGILQPKTTHQNLTRNKPAFKHLNYQKNRAPHAITAPHQHPSPSTSYLHTHTLLFLKFQALFFF